MINFLAKTMRIAVFRVRESPIFDPILPAGVLLGPTWGCQPPPAGVDLVNLNRTLTDIHVYIYIYRKRERERERLCINRYGGALARGLDARMVLQPSWCMPMPRCRASKRP